MNLSRRTLTMTIAFAVALCIYPIASLVGTVLSIPITFILLAVATYKLHEYIFPAPFVSPIGKSVLITGCDTGFGNVLAQQLADDGYSVFAGCYSKQSVQALESLERTNLYPLVLDITKPEHIESAYKFVQSKTDSLWALVNNAGINAGFVVDMTSIEDYQRCWEVNTLGGIRMTKAFWTMLAASSSSNTEGKKTADDDDDDYYRGRLVNMTSCAALSAAPCMSAYAATKMAFEGFSDSFRRETQHNFRISTSIIEPGFHRTPLVVDGDRQQAKLWLEQSQDVKERWGEKWFSTVTGDYQHIVNFSADPQHVIDAYKHAIGSTAPKLRYKVGRDAFIIKFLNVLPSEITDWLQHKLSSRNQVRPASALA